MRPPSPVSYLYFTLFIFFGPYLGLSAASEVSSILESRIAGTSVGGDVQETGRVLSAYKSLADPFSRFTDDFTAIGDGIARVYGASNFRHTVLSGS